MNSLVTDNIKLLFDRKLIVGVFVCCFAFTKWHFQRKGRRRRTSRLKSEGQAYSELLNTLEATEYRKIFCFGLFKLRFKLLVQLEHIIFLFSGLTFIEVFISLLLFFI